MTGQENESRYKTNLGGKFTLFYIKYLYINLKQASKQSQLGAAVLCSKADKFIHSDID